MRLKTVTGEKTSREYERLGKIRGTRGDKTSSEGDRGQNEAGRQSVKLQCLVNVKMTDLKKKQKQREKKRSNDCPQGGTGTYKG